MYAHRWLASPGLVALLALAACSSSTQEPLSNDPSEAVVAGTIGQTFELKPGQTARVGNDGLLVGFRAVAQDSRCPVDVTCVWAGDAELRLAATRGSAAWTALVLHTTLEPRSQKFDKYTISVVDLKPAPRSGQRIASNGYTATLRVD